MFFKAKKINKDRYYFDYAASAPMDKDVIETVVDVSSQFFANPGSLHQEAINAKFILEESRTKIASFFSAQSDEIVFTSGGTESDVLAMRGVIENAISGESKTRPHVVMSAIEHAAVKDTLESLEKSKKITLSVLPVDKDGLVVIDELKNLVTKKTVLVTVAYVNNEIGVVQDIIALSKEVRRLRKKFYGDRHSHYPVLHTDASQALISEEIRVTKLGVDLLTCNAGKIYGPKGVGMLFVKRGTPITPILYPGGQEKGLRPGTEPIALIAGFSKAIEKISGDRRQKVIEKFESLRRFFVEGLHERAAKKEVRELGFKYKLNGGLSTSPHIVSVSIQGLESDQLVIELDAKGVAVSAKSACKTLDPQTSHVLSAIGYKDNSWGTVRFSFGKETLREDIEFALDALEKVSIKLLHTKKEFNL